MQRLLNLFTDILCFLQIVEYSIKFEVLHSNVIIFWKQIVLHKDHICLLTIIKFNVQEQEQDQVEKSGGKVTKSITGFKKGGATNVRKVPATPDSKLATAL